MRSFLWLLAGLLGASGSALADDKGYNVTASLGGSDDGLPYAFSETINDPLTRSNETVLTAPSTTTTMLPRGAVAGFDSEFDFGRFANLAAGLHLTKNFRVEAEVSYLQHDVDMFRAFQIENQDFNVKDEEDPDQPYMSDPLDIDLNRLITDRQGRIETKATFANSFLDLPIKGRAIKPYIGAGIGVAQIDVDYRPGGLRVIDDSQTQMAYQVMIGATYAVRGQMDMVINARYRGLEGAEFDSSILPKELDLSGEGVVAEFGFRHNF